MAKRQIPVGFDPEQDKWLHAYSAKAGISIGEIVRAGVALYRKTVEKR